MPVTLTFMGSASGSFSILCVFLALLCVSRVSFLDVFIGRDRLVPAHRFFVLCSGLSMVFHSITVVSTPGVFPASVRATGIFALLSFISLSIPDAIELVIHDICPERDITAGLRVRKRFPDYRTRELIRYAQAIVSIVFFVHVFTIDIARSNSLSALGNAVPGFSGIATKFLMSISVGLSSVMSFALWLSGNHSWRYGSGGPSLKVLEVIRETGLATTIRFEKPAGYEYKPGQFVFLRFVSSVVPDEEHPFVLSSSPTERKFMSVTVKARGEFTNGISAANTDDLVIVSRPYGSFFWKDEPSFSKHVFIAGGIGITPFLSILNYLADRDGSQSILLLYCARTHEDLVCSDDFNSFLRTVPALTVVPVLSNDPLWKGAKGFLSRELLMKSFPEKFGSGTGFNDAEWWVSGPDGLIRSARNILRGLGIRRRYSHFFRFRL